MSIPDISEQESARDAFRTKIEDIEDEKQREYAKRLGDDTILSRFLRARRYDVNAAFEMFYDTVKFRMTFQDIGVDAVTHKLVPNELKDGKSFFHKYDKDGRPVCIIRARHHHPSTVDPLEAQRFCVFMMEYGRTLLKPPVDTVTIIFDMTDTTVANMDLRSLRFMISLLQSHYPECLGKILIYNSPWFMWGMWKLIKPWLDPATAVKVYFSDKDDLPNHIPAQDLLVEYGGLDPFEYNYEAFISQLPQVVKAEQAEP